MRLLAIILIVLTRLVLVQPLLLLWWVLRLAKGLVLAIGDTAVFLVRLLIGGVLRPLGHRYALLAATLAVCVAGAYVPELQNPSFYGVLAGSVLACFLAGKFGGALLPKSAPDFSRMVPPLPGVPSWPRIPPPRPRKPKPIPADEDEVRRREPAREPAMPVRPRPTHVSVPGYGGAAFSPSEADATAALPEALQQLMRQKSPANDAAAAQRMAARRAPE